MSDWIVWAAPLIAAVLSGGGVGTIAKQYYDAKLRALQVHFNAQALERSDDATTRKAEVVALQQIIADYRRELQAERDSCETRARDRDDEIRRLRDKLTGTLVEIQRQQGEIDKHLLRIVYLEKTAGISENET